jgi:hypothetical protein
MTPANRARAVRDYAGVLLFLIAGQVMANWALTRPHAPAKPVVVTAAAATR